MTLEKSPDRTSVDPTETALTAEPAVAAGETVDSFHRGRFHLVQPLGRGHRAGMDAMLLAALVPDPGSTPIKVADLGAGAGAAGMAVAVRVASAQVLLVERAAEMATFARRSLALPGNAAFADRLDVLEADVALSGRARVEAGLPSDVFDHVVMNPPFNNGADRRTPDALKAAAHAMNDGLFDAWLRTAGAILRPGGQVSLIARPESIGEIVAACGRRFGGLEITPLLPRAGENAVRILVTGIKQSRARLSLRAPLVMHGEGSHAFLAEVDDLNNGRAFYARR
ncbi:tRNA1(Val) A37 N6-methylase TrmN6 [Rhizobium sp. PP-F2F-G48]|uniref:tRNA1(Val) (adenine(37)-N6)-methyltransferase n=1 Tax=Rhizobium sp. PP-F2F-G48 TaxID=2135651 RepID=UPI00104B55E9|nr:methyltransferase [Rhizobium sp. PP-F2F-G48]TCM55835.1 tRNA1(Val) A37 N6-methylase TrmN6 [Rhizobium sp. PP-F2F-G48]